MSGGGGPGGGGIATAVPTARPELTQMASTPTNDKSCGAPTPPFPTGTHRSTKLHLPVGRAVQRRLSASAGQLRPVGVFRRHPSKFSLTPSPPLAPGPALQPNVALAHAHPRRVVALGGPQQRASGHGHGKKRREGCREPAFPKPGRRSVTRLSLSAASHLPWRATGAALRLPRPRRTSPIAPTTSPTHIPPSLFVRCVADRDSGARTWAKASAGAPKITGTRAAAARGRAHAGADGLELGVAARSGWRAALRVNRPVALARIAWAGAVSLRIPSSTPCPSATARPGTPLISASADRLRRRGRS